MLKLNCCALLVLVSLVNVSHAVEISSGNFSMGFGADSFSVINFTTNETSGVNTPNPSPGQFAFTYSFSDRNGTAYEGAASGYGPTFGGRVLTDGTPPTEQVSGWSPNFQFTVNANYLGAVPGDAVPGSAKLRLNIDSIRIYGMAHTAYQIAPVDPLDMHWSETTVLNPGASAAQTLPSASATASISSYAQLTWNPSEFLEVGLGSSRTFVLDTINGYNFATNAGARVIDGFEIFGSATLVYDLPAPEPSSAMLLGLGLVGLSRVRRQRSRRVEC